MTLYVRKRVTHGLNHFHFYSFRTTLRLCHLPILEMCNFQAQRLTPAIRRSQELTHPTRFTHGITRPSSTATHSSPGIRRCITPRLRRIEPQVNTKHGKTALCEKCTMCLGLVKIFRTTFSTNQK